jgi:6-phosphogluconolactonase
MSRMPVLFLCLCFSSLLAVAQSTGPAPALPTPGSTAVDRYAFAAEANSGSKSPLIVGYSINPQNGFLRGVTSVAPPSDNDGIVVDPSNKFLYLPDGPQVVGYRIAVNGTLQALNGSPFSLDGGSTMVFTPSGLFAYSNLGTEFSVNTTTGALTQIGSVDPNGIHEDIAINPSGSFVYILNSTSISVFAVDQSSGLLTEITGSPFDAGTTDRLWSGAVSPNGTFLFATSELTGNSAVTAVFSINSTTGVLTPVAGSPFSTEGGETIVDSSSQFLYVGSALDLGAYSIDSTTGVITELPGSPYPVPAGVNALTLDPTGKFLYVSLFAALEEAGSPGIITYSLNATTGALTKTATDGSAGLQVEALAISTGAKPVTYTPKFAYASNKAAKTISEWTIAESTGTLTAVAGSPVTDVNGPQLMVVTPSGAFVYTANANNTVSEYSVNATTGALTLVKGSPLTGFGSVNGLAVDSTGTYLFVLDSTKAIIVSYIITAKTGALIPYSSTAALANAQTLTIDPAGITAVVASSTSVESYGVNTGVLLGDLGSATATKTLGAATLDQSAQYIFVTEPQNNAVVTFNAAAWSEQLKQLSSAATGNNPGAVLAEPSGKYVYVANTSDGTISAYSLNRSTGALKQIGSAIAAAAGTNSMSTSNDGKYLYATNGTAGSVSIFKINSTGSLTASGTSATGSMPTSIATTGAKQ